MRFMDLILHIQRILEELIDEKYWLILKEKN